MKTRFTPWIRGCASVAILLCMSTVARAQDPANPINPTHYWTYQIENPVQATASIRVSDQFFRQPVPLTVVNRIKLLNWVHKNNSAVPDTFLHYTWWDVQPKLPMERLARVANQFGSANVRIHNVEFLLTPALKNISTNQPPLANHYLCYRADGFPAPPASFDFQDEWRRDFQHPQDMQFLCAPCMKEHNGVVYAPIDTVTHYAVYPITPNSEFFSPYLLDQFVVSQHFVHQVPIEWLFVPSTKVEIPTPAAPTTWGRIKGTYR